ncbi:MAG TPA: hypothetical protein VGB69_00165 [Edaphobacter sp.]
MWQQVELALSQSAHRALVTLANFLPGMLALLLAILILTLIGALLAALLKRLLTAIRFDERLSRNSLIPLDWAPAHGPTLLVTRAVFWANVIMGFLIGISAFDAAYAGNSQMSFFLLPYLTHSVGAVLLFIAGTLLARFLARTVLIEAVNARLHYARFLSVGVKWLVLVLTAATVLDHLEIGGTVVDLAFGILFGGIVLTLSLAVGLGSRDIVSRSLERNVDTEGFPPESYKPHTTTTSETLRHF